MSNNDEIIRFRTQATTGAVERVDRDAGIIYGASAIQIGEANGHGMMVDETTLSQVAERGDAAGDAGVKMRFCHPGLCSDGLGRAFGRAKNFRIDGDKVLADIHMRGYAAGSPDGDIRAYLLDMAEEAPEDFGLSIAFSGFAAWPMENGDEIIAESEMRPHKAITDLPSARVVRLRAVDAVDEPAANVDGLFAAAFSGTSNMDAASAFAQLDGLVEKYELDRNKAITFVERYFENRTGSAPAPVTKKEDIAMGDPTEKPVEQGQEAAPIDHTEAVNAALAEQKKVIEYAESYGLSAKDAFGKPMNEVKDLVIKHLAAKHEATPAPAEKVVVSKDETDKFGQAVAKGWTGEPGGIRFSALELIRKSACMSGENAEYWSENQLAHYGMRSISGSNFGNNKSSGMFPNLLGNTANKQLLAGFDQYVPQYADICRIADANDFNAHPNAGLSTGVLYDTDENEAHQEIIQKGGNYSSQLKNRGGILSLTLQMMMADQLGEFMDQVRRAGYAANYTIDYNVFYALLNATWTNDVTSSAALGTAGNFDKVRAALGAKLTPAGTKSNLNAARLIVDPINKYNADLVTGNLYSVGTGATTMVGSNEARVLGVVASNFIGDTSIYSSANTTDYYVAGDPNIVDTIKLEFLRGQRRPVITQLGETAVDSVDLKVRMPHAATVATYTDSAGNSRVAGIQKATA